MTEKPSLKLVTEPAGKPEPSKVSAVILAFAESLLFADPAGPPNIEAVRSTMQLAEMCWNLPVLERARSPLYPSAKKSFDEALASMPSLASQLLRQLIHDRKTKFAALPFAVSVQVKGNDLDDMKVAAEARMLQAPGEATI